MEVSESRLFKLFDYLRRHGVPLGVSEYIAAIQCLLADKNIDNIDLLRRLLRLLWAKSTEDLELFDLAFAELTEPQRDPSLREEFEPATLTEKSKLKESTPKSAPEKRIPAESPNPLVQFPELTEFQISPAKPLLITRKVQLGVVQSLIPDSEDQVVTYRFTPQLPLRRREMATIWRHFRRLQRLGPDEELDAQSTIEEICRTGFFLRPKLKPRRRNQARLLLLLDREGSMAPFNLLVDTLVESIQRGGMLGGVILKYFHDCPREFLFADPQMIEALPLEEVLAQHARETSVLVVSDAGAARGQYEGQRVKDTRGFLETLATYTYLYAWLNPVPVRRWRATSAEDIARLVPMFSLSRDGLQDCINILRGLPFPPGINLEWQMYFS
jgi:uncharacterized protein with von Willebrand factor type A (vWA) domain